MAVLTFANAANSDDYYLPDLFEFDLEDPNEDVIVETFPNQVTAQTERGPGGVLITATGTDFAYRQDVTGSVIGAMGGTVTEVTLSVNGQLWLTISGLAIELSDLEHFMLGWVRDGFYRTGNGFDLFSLFLSGDDTINGSDNGDDIIGGRNAGNDLIYGGGGRDFIKADAGNDTIFGGDDRDTYSLSETFFDGGAFRGATVNLATGVALDSWGGTDTISGIERVEGSRMSDRFTGSDEEEVFAGLRGNDTINGGGGDDLVRYDRDARWGGTLGVNVNLQTGVATDGWGGTDRLSSIEGVWGTSANDTLVGNGADNTFSGGAGVDVIRGAGGWDVADFYNNAALAGAVVNLSRANGQVRNDGFGNVETITGIEELWGTFRADTFTGNSANNSFYGDAGGDTISGGGGNDTLNGASGQDRLTGGAGSDVFVFDSFNGDNPFGDTITDFTSGTDRLGFVTEVFDGMSTVLQFRNGASAGAGGGSWFFFDTATDQLFWDRDGRGGDAAIVVATLTGVNRLVAADFDLF